MEIEKKLKDVRIQAGLTQEQVAEKIMVSRQTVSNWENGKSLPDIVSMSLWWRFLSSDPLERASTHRQ